MARGLLWYQPVRKGFRILQQQIGFRVTPSPSTNAYVPVNSYANIFFPSLKFLPTQSSTHAAYCTTHYQVLNTGLDGTRRGRTGWDGTRREPGPTCLTPTGSKCHFFTSLPEPAARAHRFGLVRFRQPQREETVKQRRRQQQKER